MALVAYGSSDESEEELSLDKAENLNTSYCNSLSISKKQRETVRITIPSLKKLSDDEDEMPIKKAKLQSGSGLFSLLPPPKYSSPLSNPDFIPKVLMKKKEFPGKSSIKPVFREVKFTADAVNQIPVIENVTGNQESDESDHETSKLDPSSDILPEKNYFSLNFSNSLEEKDVANLNNDELLKRNCVTASNDSLAHNVNEMWIEQPANESVSGSFLENSIKRIPNSQQQDFSVAKHYEIPTGSNVEQSFLEDEGFRKLQGRHCEFENIDIIDVNADDQLSNKNEWLMKSLTEEKDIRPARRKHNMPTQQQKRKHQITYLAFQAKERELDLKNQWALNSRTRRETQAKYGF